jgi:hypothetical protein
MNSTTALRTLCASGLFLVAGCSSMPLGGPPTLVPQPSAGQDVKENPASGGQALQSIGQSSIVRVQQMFGDNLEEHGALFEVVVVNLDNRSVSFGLEDIGVETKGQPGSIVSRTRLMELEEGKKSTGDTLGSLVSAGAMLGGIMATVVTGVSGQNLSQDQIQSASQSIAGGMTATFEASSKIKESHSTASDARMELFDLLTLQRNQIEPGATAGGYFVMETKAFNFNDTLVRVRVGADEHLFKFKPKLF